MPHACPQTGRTRGRCACVPRQASEQSKEVCTPFEQKSNASCDYFKRFRCTIRSRGANLLVATTRHRLSANGNAKHDAYRL